MNSTYDNGLLSPLAQQYLQDGGSQQTSMGTPRPGTPRGSHFRLSPDGNLNPGTPGAASSHDHHKVPNSPWSGSEPATPGSGYSRNGVVPNSPYISSYPNTPATPGGGGFYQKPCGIPPSNGNCNNTTAVPPGSSSPWTDRSVCTPGPMTPLTPATPMHSTMSEHGGSSFGNNGSPTFPSDSSSNGSSSNGNCGKSMHNAPSLQALLQEGPPQSSDSLLPVPVMNHNVQQTQQQQQPQQPPQQQQQQNGNSVNANIALPSLPNISERDINQAVDTNPNLITEFEQFFADFINSKNQETTKQRLQNNVPMQNQNRQQQQPPPQQQQQQQHQQPQQPQSHQQQQQQLMNTMNPMNMNGNPNGMMYQNGNGMGPNPNNQGPPGSMMMSMNNGHNGPNQHLMNNGMYMVGGGGGGIGPMRNNKFIGQPHHPGGHGQHPYAMTMGSNNGGGNGNGLMMRARQIPNGHLHPQPQHNNQYGPGPHTGMPPQHHPQQHHPHPSQQNMLGQMQGNRVGGNQFSLHHQQPSASVYAPPPSGNNGGYVQIQQQQQQQQQQPPQHNNVNVPPPNYQNVQNHHPHPQQNTGPVHWQNNAQQQQQQQQQPQPNQHSQSLNNHGMMNTGGQNGMMNGAGQNGMMSTNGQNGMMPNRVMPPQSQQQPSQQPNPYFQNNTVVNQVASNDQGLNGGGSGGSVLPPTTYPFDLNGGSGPGSVNNSNSLPMTPGTSAIQSGGTPLTPQQVPVQSPMSMSMGMPSTPQPNTPHMVGPVEDVVLDLDGPYDGSGISQALWTKAADKAGRANAVCEVGKVLFDEIFTDDEVIYCTLSGRGSTKKFNQNKVVYLKKATAWLMTRPARPWEFSLATCGDISLNQEDESGVRGVEKKVFTEYRSRRRSDILKARQQTGGPPSVSSVS